MKFLALLLAATVAAGPLPPVRGFTPEEQKTEREREGQARQFPQLRRIHAEARWLSAQPHAAGSPRSEAVARHIAGLLRQWGLDTDVETFEPLLPYPVVRVLELTAPRRYTALLREPPVDGDKDSRQSGQIATYNAYSASGDVTAPLVYVNYGVAEDYEELSRRGIDVRGKIVIARYGKSWRGVKPKLAQEHGATGCIIYSDPREDGYFEGDVYPVGPYRPSHGVQRGSVIDMALYPGDPLTPGWASEPGARRLALSEAKPLMRIPVLPVSAADAQPLLSALGGQVAPVEWRGALPITYRVGPGPATVHLKLDFDWTNKPVHDVIARIPGSMFPDQWVMWGNHHDAWVNGASDPVSGASALLEAAHSLAELTKRGWRPKRTILFAFWDAEEFGLIGSTEWAEKHRAELDKKLAVYLNTDSNGRGRLSGSGSPSLETFVNELARDLTDPVTGKTLAESVKSRRDKSGRSDSAAIRLGSLGAGSDYVPFIGHIGVSSLNLSFGGDDGGGVYHSIYDTFGWYQRFSDGEFIYGRALSQVIVLALMRLGGATTLPYEFGTLARAVRGYADEVQSLGSSLWGKSLDLREVYAQAGRLDGNARNYEDALEAASRKLAHAPSGKLAKLNAMLYRTERAMLSPKGLPGREWYRHQLFAPGLYTGYGAKTLPGIREAAEASRWEESNREAASVAQSLRALNSRIEEAARMLRELED